MASRSKRLSFQKSFNKDEVENKALRQKFIRTFEKPSQIYSVLCIRNIRNNPLFLTRTLWYMKHRMSRNHKARKSFKVDDILVQRMKKLNTQNSSIRIIDEYRTLKIVFLRFISEEGDTTEKDIKCYVDLKTIYHKKRNDVVAPFSERNMYNFAIPAKLPQEKSKFPVTMEFPAHLFTFDATTKAYLLLFKLQCKTKTGVLELCSELPVCDENSCFLENGEYKLLLCQPEFNDVSNRELSYEDTENFNSENYETHFERGPLIELAIAWSKKPSKLQQSLVSVSKPRNESKDEGIETKSTVQKDPQGSQNTASDLKVAFMFEVGRRHWPCNTEAAATSTTCPWCQLACRHLYPLLKHLTLCHPRLLFKLKHKDDMNLIMVSLNMRFDGSYEGNQGDLVAQRPRKAFSRGGVQSRSTCTEIIVVHPKHCIPNISEFYNPIEINHVVIKGHKRTYYNQETRLPFTKSEEKEECNNDPEKAPEWMHKMVGIQMDLFKDVNEGEKQVLTMWNQHMMEHHYIAESQMKEVCMTFVHFKGCEIIKKNLYKNFVLHLTCLFDHGLLCSQDVYEIICAIQKIGNM